MSRLKGKVALVTGAARGIGECIATTFAEQGAFVIATDLTQPSVDKVAKEIHSKGGSAVALVLDVTSQQNWEDTAGYILNEFGKLDVLANCAGIEMVREISDLTLEEYRLTQAVNTEAAFIGPKALLALLTKAGNESEGGASIVNISSIAGLLGIPDQLAYNTSKGAVRQLTKAMAIEFAHHGRNIRVNSIHPGCIDTPMLREAMEDWQRTNKIGTTDMAQIEKCFADVCPMKKIGKPKDIAMGALYLSSEESGFVTGLELVIDGGSFASWL